MVFRTHVNSDFVNPLCCLLGHHSPLCGFLDAAPLWSAPPRAMIAVPHRQTEAMAATHAPRTAALPAEEERDSRLSRADWLAHALQTLVREGIDQVKIQSMARGLGVARSSFYWHFDSREALLDAMMEEWLQKNTGPIIERAMRPAADVNFALISVSECWLHPELFDPALDVAVRLWARRSDAVRATVLQADTMRIEALKTMFLRYGYEHTDALIRARTIYFTQIGQFTLEDIDPPPLREIHAVDYIRIFTGVPLTEAHLQALRTAFRRRESKM